MGGVVGRVATRGGVLPFQSAWKICPLQSRVDFILDDISVEQEQTEATERERIWRHWLSLWRSH